MLNIFLKGVHGNLSAVGFWVPGLSMETNFFTTLALIYMPGMLWETIIYTFEFIFIQKASNALVARWEVRAPLPNPYNRISKLQGGMQDWVCINEVELLQLADNHNWWSMLALGRKKYKITLSKMSLKIAWKFSTCAAVSERVPFS